LRAASRLFLDKGYVATAVEDIAREAGVTTGAVYSNFATKEDMFLALVDALPHPESTWLSEEATAPNDLAAAVGATPEERAEAWGRAVAHLEPDLRVVALLAELNAAALRSDRSRRRVAEHNIAFFRDLGHQLVELLDGDPADAELLGLLAQSIYSGFVAHIAITGTPVPEADFARAYRLLAVLASDRQRATR
jgi:AcrR family transcriptional regulator